MTANEEWGLIGKTAIVTGGGAVGDTSPACSGPCAAGYACAAGTTSATAVLCGPGRYAGPGASACAVCVCV